MTLLKKPAGEPGSRSRCPAHYKRPRVLVLHSRGARPGLLARYVGGQLALGGYADVDVRPWRDGGAALPEAAAAPPADAGVKDLRAFLARRGASAPRGAAEKADLRAACVHAAARPRVVLWAADAMSARGEVLDPADLRVHHLGPDAALLGTCDLVLACVAGKDAGECGACLAPLLAGGGAPVIHLACDPGDHVSAFEAAFADKARPASAGSIAVAGALLLEVGARHRDGALVQLGGRGLALERLDAARADAGLGKFYDLLSTSGLPLVFERRARLARLAWGHALLYAPLLAAHAACGGALPAAARATAAAASREARLALAAAAGRAARHAARAALAEGGRAPRAAPAPICARRAWAVLYSAAALEAAVALAPAWLWRAWVAPLVLGFEARAERAVEAPDAMDARAGVDGAGALAALEAACAPDPCQALAALRRALRDLRVANQSADAAQLFEAAGRPRAVASSTRRALRGCLVAVIALMLFFVFLDLAFPSRGAQFRAFDEL